MDKRDQIGRALRRGVALGLVLVACWGLSLMADLSGVKERLAALGQDTSGMSGFACMDALEKATGTTAPTQLSGLRDLPVLHEDVCNRAKMGAFVESACARIVL